MLVAQVIEVVLRLFVELSRLLWFDFAGKSVHLGVVVICTMAWFILVRKCLCNVGFVFLQCHKLAFIKRNLQGRALELRNLR